MPARLSRLAQLKYPSAQARNVRPTCGDTHSLQDVIRPGNLLQLTNFTLQIIELLAIRILGPGLLEVEIHVHGGPGAEGRRHEEIQAGSQQGANQGTEHPEAPGPQEANEIFKRRRGE